MGNCSTGSKCRSGRLHCPSASDGRKHQGVRHAKKTARHAGNSTPPTEPSQTGKQQGSRVLRLKPRDDRASSATTSYQSTIVDDIEQLVPNQYDATLYRGSTLICGHRTLKRTPAPNAKIKGAYGAIAVLGWRSLFLRPQEWTSYVTCTHTHASRCTKAGEHARSVHRCVRSLGNISFTLANCAEERNARRRCRKVLFRAPENP